MKAWLIDNFGSVKSVADGQIRAIKALKVPRVGDSALTHANYVREMHRLLSTLYNLEIRRGVKVPQLRDYITSHTFILQVAELLPQKVKSDWTESLARDQTIIHKIQGETHLLKILDILKQRYISYELLAGISPDAPATEPPPSRTLHAERDPSPTPSVASSCKSCAHDTAHAASVPPKTSRPTPTKPKANSSKADGATRTPKPKPIPWSCTFKGHTNHLIIDCPEFFDTPVKTRRWKSRWSCYTCFSLAGACRKGCKNVASVPKVLLCPECESADPTGSKSVNVLMCGLQNHTKPDDKDITKALEAWIPGFKASRLTNPVNVGFTLLMAAASSNPPRSRSSAPDPAATSTTFDSSTGTSRPLSPGDRVVKRSKEVSFYVMQQFCIAGEAVLAFFDSGSNTHLVDGEFAERAGFRVIDSTCTRIGVIGGGDIWSEYGVYSCILGPDLNDQFH
jgi:hypothetical protein